ncbi:MAG: acetyl-CoA carboxylase biotin carboxyl carrier protein subunit [Dethiobacter sp.]|jgi:glutaconyl-CoA decarboxylase|nr:acetyl-CoA carboxylase biotin carboxyl carrier protein subunit [Dethiobacter sp.]MBS3983430.1 acetyl-CoA carboxylase biotin carboxyl carrier protein subunit [Dethiobacter sp.]MCL4463356.1 biotin/lipoyl-binding protein [Bacillota bacterium]MCL5992570.1 biotin/lipoyl-binding protein [Bacillota bacterium]
MRAFRVTVNGLSYDVSVEELAAAPAVRTAPQSVAAPKQVAAPIAAPAKAAHETAAKPTFLNGEAVLAPMPGVVLNVMVEIGQTVNCGDVLLILEAMKMENEVTAPVAGTIKEIAVAKGASVNARDLMLVIE